MAEIEAGNITQRGTLRIVLAYAIFAGLWILLSDRAMGLLFDNPETLVQASMAKGWFFVAVTSLLLYVLVRRLIGQIAAAHRRELAMAHELQRVPAMLSALADNTDDAIFIKDIEGHYLLFNKAAARFVGKSANDILGHDDRALFPPDQAQMLMAIGRRVIATGKTETNEETLHTSDGTKVFLATKGPIRDSNGNVFGIFGISRDITARKMAEIALHERDHRLEAIIGHSPSALSLKHLDGRYALANPNLQRIHHMSEAEIVGKTDFDLYPEEFARVFQANDRQVLASMSRQSIEEVVPVDGVPRIYISHIFPVLDDLGRAEYVCRISLDITERKQVEQELNLRLAELEQFNRATIGRELDMIRMKETINALNKELGRAPPYDLSFAEVLERKAEP